MARCPKLPKKSSTSKDGDSGDENRVRGNWSGKLDFFFSLVGYAVGLGNIWRFPYLCMRNGGGAFLIPYFLFLLLCGIPLFIMELSIGQFSSLGPSAVGNICPLFKGIGLGMVIVCYNASLYYECALTWVLYYLGMSFTSELPWATCDHSWNTENCRERVKVENTTIENFYGNITDFNLTNPTIISTLIPKNLSDSNMTKRVSPAEEFFENHVLGLTDGIEHIGGLRWQLVVCHLAGWLIVYGCIIKGIKSAGKVVYVTATVPYLFLTVLLIRTCLMPGAMDGISYYLTPDFSKLGNVQIWTEALLQTFYSLGPAWGGLLTYASYNKFHNNCYRDGIVVPLINSATSFYAGFVVFSVIGVVAHKAGVRVEDAMTSGPGLVFIVYPEALATFPLAPLWSALFFLMLLSVGVDSQFVNCETVISGIVDRYPRIFNSPLRRRMLLTVFVVNHFLLGLIFLTGSGMYIFQIWDWYCAAFAVIVFCAFESFAVSWFYGIDRLMYDIEFMTGHRPFLGFKQLLSFVAPLLMLCCFLYSVVVFSAPKYGNYTYPAWARGLGWFLALISLLPIPICLVKELMKREGTFRQRLKQSIKPSPKWGPALEKHREGYKYGDTSHYNCVPILPVNGTVESSERQKLEAEEQSGV